MESEMAKSEWGEYSRLVLNELERLNQGQIEIKADLAELKMSNQTIVDTKEWKNKVTEVWSPTQMQQAKNEVYGQKNRWAVVTGIVIAIQILFSLLVIFKDRLF
ncbi:MAG: hypothetical protein UT24_C0046G0008 [Candidatus Woesebacteria bacterium GW2011_GWB1_39_12]|uniref:Uncharacterized protein n=1 Tax=Candidatus Woesebacteria bacterium GW2011_GWB1_39_12 TaxID=1618574 RepID=A0A0G0Q7C5_9BACT|nr:MAG: hypothetical protein UT24_C0046G0008 [Candidatus Woesebacteria bacterium GW2011_GWB1_39_12]